MPTTGLPRRALAPLVAALALALGGCGLDVQTLKPYNQSIGVNADAQSVKVRNLLLIADNAGKGAVSATVFTPTDDTITSATVMAHKLDGSDAAAVQVMGTTPIKLTANTAVVLTDPAPAFRLTGSDLKPGYTAQVTLVFGSGAQVSVTAPVVASDNPYFAGIPLG